MAKTVPLILVGLVIAYSGAAELIAWLRCRRRLRRVMALIIDLRAPGAGGTAQRGRAPVVRFITEEGQSIDAVSSAWSFPEPTVGTFIPVTYDPADPRRSAERPGVRSVKLILSPLLIAFGVGLAAFGLGFL